MAASLLDLESQLVFYKAYHNTTINVLIHSVFVPLILFSSARILNDVPLGHGFTLAHLLALVFGTFYVMLHRPAGMLASSMLALMCYVLNNGQVRITVRQAWTVFVVSWIFQFIGHGFFEKRKPALLDNLVQSLVLAPYFILFELLFLLGLLPELRKSLQDRTDRELRRLREQKTS